MENRLQPTGERGRIAAVWRDRRCPRLHLGAACRFMGGALIGRSARARFGLPFRVVERQQVANVGVRCTLRQLSQYLQQPGVGFNAAGPARQHQTIDHRTRFRAIRSRTEEPALATCTEWPYIALDDVMPTPRLCRVMNPRTQRLGGSLFPVIRIFGIIREPPGRRATDLEACSVSAQRRSPWRAQARVP